jgi:protein-S-isoprenylcysteine O-methyltransferase Ste14
VHLAPGVRVLAVLSGVVWFVTELQQSVRRRPEATDEDRGSRRVLGAAMGVGVVAAFLATRWRPDLDVAGRAASWAGLVLLWCGIGLRVWSFRTLGRLFTFTVQTSPGQPVIARGPYRLVRHPSYLGMLLAVLGLGLLIGNWLSLVLLTTCATCGLVYRIHVEEQALVRSMGDDYRDYARTHKRLVPFVW